MKIAIAIIIAALLISGSILFIGRWEISAIPGGGIVAYRLDRWSGTIDYCTIQYPPSSGASDFVAKLDQAGAFPVACQRPRVPNQSGS